jgi:two-component system, OmpR family, sensor histidine kinase KdpD
MVMETRDSERPSSQRFRVVLSKYGYIFAVLCIVASTCLFIPGRTYFAKGQWALLYLLIIAFVGSLSGPRPAVLAAGLAFLAWNYFFLPPYHTFYVHDAKDWIALLAFLAVGIAMGIQTGRMREREADALSREGEMKLLNSFSAHLVSDMSVPDMADALLVELSRITGAECAVIMLPDGSGKLHPIIPSHVSRCGPGSTALALAEWSYQQAKAVGLPAVRDSSETADKWPISVSHDYTRIAEAAGDICLPLLSTTQREGVLYVGSRHDGAPYEVHEARLLVAAANLVAAFLERKRLQSVAVQADALREADRLKSTLVSSVSHELKTPLAAMTATVSNLFEEDFEWDPAVVRTELESVRSDLDRLNASIGSLVDLSRLESAAWEPRKEPCDLGDILGTALSKLPAKVRDRVSFEIPDDLPQIEADFQQWARALGNLLENALIYGGPDSPVRVAASVGERDIRVSVEDAGPGVPADDREKIFEKFYRGGRSANAPSGTGLGLAITREIVRFHGGRIWVEDAVPHGARFVISLPNRKIPEEGQ